MSGTSLYCETPKRSHGNPLRNRATNISRATQMAAAQKAQPARCAQVVWEIGLAQFTGKPWPGASGSISFPFNSGRGALPINGTWLDSRVVIPAAGAWLVVSRLFPGKIFQHAQTHVAG